MSVIFAKYPHILNELTQIPEILEPVNIEKVKNSIQILDKCNRVQNHNPKIDQIDEDPHFSETLKFDEKCGYDSDFRVNISSEFKAKEQNTPGLSASYFSTVAPTTVESSTLGTKSQDPELQYTQIKIEVEHILHTTQLSDNERTELIEYLESWKQYIHTIKETK